MGKNKNEKCLKLSHAVKYERHHGCTCNWMLNAIKQMLLFPQYKLSPLQSWHFGVKNKSNQNVGILCRLKHDCCELFL
jgi:hypothetical protein